MRNKGFVAAVPGVLAAFLGALAAWAPGAVAVDAPPCGETGVWIQILGAGGPELDDTQGASSYVVWLDNRARLLVDTAPGASVRFDEIGAPASKTSMPSC